MRWESKALDSFPVSWENIILVTDPDGVLKEERIIKNILDKGFILLEMEDPVTFRYLFETKYRYSKDWGRLIIRIEGDEFNQFPYEYLREGYRVSLKLYEFFPKLNYLVVKQLPPGSLNILYESYKNYTGENLGERMTVRFILQNVYGIIPGLIGDRVELFRHLFRLHLKDINLPYILVKILLEDLKIDKEQLGFSMENAFLERENFFDLAQKQWELFVFDLQNKTQKALIPFNSLEIKVFIDSLFLEGILKPVKINKPIDDFPNWVRLGIQTDEKRIKIAKISEMVDKLNYYLSEEANHYKKWFRIANLLGETQFLFFKNKDILSEEFTDAYKNLCWRIEDGFSQWLLESFGSLINLTYTNGPVMVHHIPWYINYLRNKRKMEKVALIVVDGMSVLQWRVMKETLFQKIYNLGIEEKLSYAWAPTITSVSRQAIFSGEMPAYFKSSIDTTQQEQKHWERFWQNQGLKYSEIRYIKGLAKGKESILLEDSRTKIMGLVLDIIDKMTHSEQLGLESLLKRIQFWMEQGHLISVLQALFGSEYEVFLTSDHGSIEAEGQGRPNQGVLVETKGMRARVYSDPVFIEQVKEDYNSIEWPGIGLPDNMFVLLSSSNKAFTQKGKNIMGHGGISIEEVIVPFIRLWEEK